MNSERFTLLFPLWTLMGAGLALLYPPLFTWFRGDLITMGLGVIMLGMGPVSYTHLTLPTKA